ncbi:hypothetical protein O988_02642 [Pseudogymnoascus sp. VKM F-3808]|nr:hypothetical protein O988_02642 [Pseudogymnoascus sp. VKM F-3808]
MDHKTQFGISHSTAGKLLQVPCSHGGSDQPRQYHRQRCASTTLVVASIPARPSPDRLRCGHGAISRLTDSQ